jgi:glycosyltransferase involved in cell wall biosynthesis
MFGGKNDFPFQEGMFHTGRRLSQIGVPMQPFTLANESLIPRARNYIVDEFMRSGFQNLLFIDADIGFSPDDVIALLAIAAPHSQYDIVCGAYPKKCLSWEKIIAAVKSGVADQDPTILERYVGDLVLNFTQEGNYRLDMPMPVREAGTGFMLIQRHVFERIADRYPELYYKPDHGRQKYFNGRRKIMQYFHCEVETGFKPNDMFKLVKYVKEDDLESAKALANEMSAAHEKASLRYLSEDYWFAVRAAEVGCKTWILPWIKLSHTGNYVYHSDLHALASINASATLADIDVAKINQ